MTEFGLNGGKAMLVMRPGSKTILFIYQQIYGKDPISLGRQSIGQPAVPRTEVQDSPSRRGRAPDTRGFVLLLVASAVGVTGFLTFNTYVTPFLLDIPGFSSDALGPMLLASGAGGLAGTLIVGRVLDRFPRAAIVVAMSMLTAGLLSILGLGELKAATVLLLAVIGMAFSGLALGAQLELECLAYAGPK